MDLQTCGQEVKDMKKTVTRSVEKMVEDQVAQWQKLHKLKKEEPPAGITLVSVSREYGSNGAMLAERIAAELGFTLFHQEVIHEMAASAKTSKRIVETLDEKGLNLLEESIAYLVNERHLWPDQYLRHLMRVIGTIGRHERSVIVGRCANFILPPEKTLRVRVIAPLPIRIQTIAKRLEISEADARKQVLKTDSDRRAFSRKYFYADLTDPFHYDLLINTGRTSIDTAVAIVRAAVGEWKQA